VRFAVCNELFGVTDLGRSLATVRETGFEGVEFAPHTVFGDFAGDMGPGIASMRRALQDNGLKFVGLHWLLVGPDDLHVTSPDDAVWSRSWDHVARLTDLAGELGGGVLVFGSPAQRASHGLMSADDALARFVDGLGTVADRARDNNSQILLEALASEHTDVMNRLEEVRGIVQKLNHPGVGTVFDFHNVGDEELPWPGLVHEFCDVFDHVHVNEMDGGAPTLASPDLAAFRRAFAALAECEYERWVSLEMFSEPEDPASVLSEVREFLGDVTRTAAPGSD
jgi:sugar phosphate isomerase/epimerase